MTRTRTQPSIFGRHNWVDGNKLAKKLRAPSFRADFSALTDWRKFSDQVVCVRGWGAYVSIYVCMCEGHALVIHKLNASQLQSGVWNLWMRDVYREMFTAPQSHRKTRAVSFSIERGAIDHTSRASALARTHYIELTALPRDVRCLRI